MNLPDYIEQETWDAFCEMRRAKGKRVPFTDYAAKLIIEDLRDIHCQGYDAHYALKKSIKSGWSGVFISQDTPRRDLNGKEQGNVRQINSMVSSAFKAMK